MYCFDFYVEYWLKCSDKKLWPLLMDGAQRPHRLKGYGTTTMRQFTFYHKVPRNTWYSFDRPQKDERLIPPSSHSGFEHQIPGLGIQCLNHWAIVLKSCFCCFSTVTSHYILLKYITLSFIF